MATGWPMKTTYANGDVYSASDVNDITGTINLLTSTTLSRSAGKNTVINGGMDIWQRGTSISVAASSGITYTADRWCLNTGANQAMTISRQATGDTTNLPNIQYCTRFQRNSGQTGTGGLFLSQSIESVNSIPLAGQTVTMSFYARKGANYSAASSALTVLVYTGTGTDQNQLSGFTGSATPISGTATLTTTWQRFTFTGTISSTVTEIASTFYFTPVGTAGAADYYEVTGVQLELGSTATTFSRAGGTIQGELAACQRYYQVIAGQIVGGNFPIVTGYASAASQTPRFPISFPVTMRVTPTMAKNGTWNLSNCTGPTPGVFIGPSGFSMEVTTSAAGVYYAYPDSTDDTFTASAEL